MKKLSLIILLALWAYNLCHAQMADSATYLSNIKTELNKVWPKNRTINLVFHGHSVPAGYAANHEVHTLDAYPTLLLQKLKAQYPYAVINIIVTAVGGETSLTGQTRFDADVLPHKPDVLFIDYALNDRTIGLDAAKAAWEKMIQEALKHNIKVILLTSNPDTRVNIMATDSKSLYAYAQQIRALAAKYHIGLADPFKDFQKIYKEAGSINDYMLWVNHPNKKGHTVIADEIFKWFSK